MELVPNQSITENSPPLPLPLSVTEKNYPFNAASANNHTLEKKMTHLSTFASFRSCIKPSTLWDVIVEQVCPPLVFTFSTNLSFAVCQVEEVGSTWNINLEHRPQHEDRHWKDKECPFCPFFYVFPVHHFDESLTPIMFLFLHQRILKGEICSTVHKMSHSYECGRQTHYNLTRWCIVCDFIWQCDTRLGKVRIPKERKQWF